MFAVHLRDDSMVNSWQPRQPRANQAGLHLREIRRSKKVLKREQNQFAFLEAEYSMKPNTHFQVSLQWTHSMPRCLKDHGPAPL